MMGVYTDMIARHKSLVEEYEAIPFSDTKEKHAKMMEVKKLHDKILEVEKSIGVHSSPFGNYRSVSKPELFVKSIFKALFNR